MPKFIFLLALAVVGYLIYKLYYKKLAAQGRAGQIKMALIVVGLIFMALAVTGRAHVLFAIIGAAMTQIMRLAPLAMRFFPMFQQAMNTKKVFTPGAGQASKVRTRLLVMTLDHDSGHIDGEVTDGSFASRSLGSLSIDELRSLYGECQRIDPEGVRLLAAYVARVHGDDWQQSDPGSQQASTTSAEPSVSEAYEILGLKDGDTKQAVVEAHRRLMGKMHPDKGGSDYLAARINLAKEVLIRHLA